MADENKPKWVNTRIDGELKARYDKALAKAKKDVGRHVSSPEVIVPGIRAFCEAVEADKTTEFLNGQYKRK